jgi:hypothetical protein
MLGQVYEYIVFQAAMIKDLSVCEPPPLGDPAILTASANVGPGGSRIRTSSGGGSGRRSSGGDGSRNRCSRQYQITKSVETSMFQSP